MGRKHAVLTIVIIANIIMVAVSLIMVAVSLLNVVGMVPPLVMLYFMPVPLIVMVFLFCLLIFSTRTPDIPGAEANRELMQIRIKDGSTTFVFEPTAEGDVLREVEMKMGNRTFVYACTEEEKKD